MIICNIIAFSIAILTSFFIGKSWIKRTRQSTVTLNAEALRNPINTGITVAGFLLPIVVGLISYLYGGKTSVVNNEYYLYSSVLLIIISIFFGLWNNYALATLTKEDGTFPITSSDNTTFPAFFVFQLSLLFFGILYIGIFSMKNISNSPEKIIVQKKISEQHLNLLVLKPHIQIATHKDSLLKSWGSPKIINQLDSTINYLYESEKSIYSYIIQNDTIIKITEKTKK